MLYLANSFSLSMLPQEYMGFLVVFPLPLETVRKWVREAEIESDLKSVVGHKSTASLYSALLDTEVSFNRESITLEEHDVLIVGQIISTNGSSLRKMGREYDAVELYKNGEIEVKWYGIGIHNPLGRARFALCHIEKEGRL